MKISIRDAGLAYEGFKHRDDKKVLEIKSKIEELQTELVKYIEQYLPEELIDEEAESSTD